MLKGHPLKSEMPFLIVAPPPLVAAVKKHDRRKA